MVPFRIRFIKFETWILPENLEFAHRAMLMEDVYTVIRIDQNIIRVDGVRAVCIMFYISQSCPWAIGFNENTLRVSGDMLVPRNFTS